MSKIKILCNCFINHIPEAKKILEEIGLVTYAEYNYKDLEKEIGKYEIVIPSLKFILDRKLLEKAKNLKLIATPSTGVDHIDLNAAKELNIEVISLKGEYNFLKNVTATAEHTFGLLISLIRKIPFAFENVKKGKWNSSEFRGYELKGKVLGIIGYGRLGSMVSKYAHSFQMKVLAYDPYKKVKVPWVKQVDLETLLKNSDIISIHVPLNEETKGLISVREFSIMKKGVFLINTSRGAIIDEKALLKSLKEGTIRGAALDVLKDELKGKIKNNPLVKYACNHDNLIITPHLGGVTYESQRKAYTYLAKKIKKFISSHWKILLGEFEKDK